LGEENRSKADYVSALKGNQGTLYEDVKEYFGDKEFLWENSSCICCGFNKNTLDISHVFL